MSIYIFVWKYRNTSCEILADVKASMTSSKQ